MEQEEKMHVCQDDLCFMIGSTCCSYMMDVTTAIKCLVVVADLGYKIHTY